MPRPQEGAVGRRPLVAPRRDELGEDEQRDGRTASEPRTQPKKTTQTTQERFLESHPPPSQKKCPEPCSPLEAVWHEADKGKCSTAGISTQYISTIKLKMGGNTFAAKCRGQPRSKTKPTASSTQLSIPSGKKIDQKFDHNTFQMPPTPSSPL